jgi:nitrate reductase NapE component
MKLQSDLLQLGLGTPEYFKALNVVIAFISVIIVVLLSYIYKLNMLVNIDELRVAAEVIGKPEIAHVDFSINLKAVVFTLLIMLVLPRQLLKVAVAVKSLMEENEVLMLQTYAMMMIKAGRPVKLILISLMDRSKLFKGVLKQAVNSFSEDPSRALRVARESAPNKGFDKTVRALEQALNHDRDVSLIFLKNHRQMTKELKALDRVRKNSIKTIVSTVLLIIPLLTFAFIAGYPFVVYSMKILSNAPV